MKFDKQRSQSKCDHHYAPNISSGFNVDNFYNICLKYFSKIKLYFVIQQNLTDTIYFNWNHPIISSHKTEAFEDLDVNEKKIMTIKSMMTVMDYFFTMVVRTTLTNYFFMIIAIIILQLIFNNYMFHCIALVSLCLIMIILFPCRPIYSKSAFKKVHYLLSKYCYNYKM